MRFERYFLFFLVAINLTFSSSASHQPTKKMRVSNTLNLEEGVKKLVEELNLVFCLWEQDLVNLDFSLLAPTHEEGVEILYDFLNLRQNMAAKSALENARTLFERSNEEWTVDRCLPCFADLKFYQVGSGDPTNFSVLPYRLAEILTGKRVSTSLLLSEFAVRFPKKIWFASRNQKRSLRKYLNLDEVEFSTIVLKVTLDYLEPIDLIDEHPKYDDDEIKSFVDSWDKMPDEGINSAGSTPTSIEDFFLSKWPAHASAI